MRRPLFERSPMAESETPYYDPPVGWPVQYFMEWQCKSEPVAAIILECKGGIAKLRAFTPRKDLSLEDIYHEKNEYMLSRAPGNRNSMTFNGAWRLIPGFPLPPKPPESESPEAKVAPYGVALVETRSERPVVKTGK